MNEEKAEESSDPFKIIKSRTKLPEDLKKEVTATIKLAHLIGAFSELFTTNMGKSASQLINQSKPRKKKSENISE